MTATIRNFIITCGVGVFVVFSTPVFAARTLIDNFNNGPAEIVRWGNPPYGPAQDTYYTVAGVIGTPSVRQIHVNDANTGTLANPNGTSLNTTYGTVEWWGAATAPSNWVSYGTAASGGGGTALGISKLLTDGFLLDIAHSTDLTAGGRPDGTFSITLNIGAGGGGGTVNWSSSGHEFAGTKAIPLSAFTGITALKAQFIDGITIQGTASYITNIASVVTPFPTSKGRGLALDNVEIAPILASAINGNWAPGTWSTARPTVADDYILVNNTVTVATAGEVAQDVSLTQAGSNLTVNPGASLSASGTVWVNTGSLSATSGGLTAGTLKVTGGTASVGGGGLIGAVNASAGTTNLGTNVTGAVNLSGTAALNLTAGVSATSAKTNQLGGSMNTGGNFLTLSSQLKLGDTNSITQTGGSFGVKGAAISNSLSQIQTLQLSGGTTAVKQQVPNTIGVVNSFPVFTGAGVTTNQVINVTTGSQVLVVEIGGRGGAAGPSPPLVTYAGSPMTLAAQADFATNLNYTGSTIWYMYNPPTGSNTLTVFAPSLEHTGAAFTLSNVDTTVSPEKTWVLTDGANSGSGTFLVPSTLQTTRVDNLVAGSAIAATYTYRQGAGTAVTWTNSSGTRSTVFTSSQSQIYTDGELILNASAGSTTITGQGGPNIRQHLAAAAFAPTFVDGAISMGLTDVEVSASTILDIGSAPSAIFGDLIPTGPSGIILRIQGNVFAAIDNLANFWDLTAPSADSWTRIDTGPNYVDLQFLAAEPVPEPSTFALAGLGLLGIVGLAWKRRQR